jgi:high-affinity Fe2+/Pb2+ permease
MNEFIITFRECLEASLIIGIIYTVLDKNNYIRKKKFFGTGFWPLLLQV